MKKIAVTLLVLMLMLCEFESNSAYAEENRIAELDVLEESTFKQEDTETSAVKSNYATGTIVPYEKAKYSLIYQIYNGEVTICGVEGDDTAVSWGDLVIPDQIDGMQVVTIGYSAFIML